MVFVRTVTIKSISRERRASYICGGSSAATDRGTQLGAEANMKDMFAKFSKLGTDLTGKGATDVTRGQQDTEKASRYYSDILSGDSSKILQAVAPEINTIGKQTDQAKSTIARSGDRTGGTSSKFQDLVTSVPAAAGNVVANARQGAAGGVQQTGAQFTNAGLSETGLGLNSLSAAEGTASDLRSGAITSRQVSQKIHDEAVQQWADLASSIMFGAITGGMGGGGAAGAFKGGVLGGLGG